MDIYISEAFKNLFVSKQIILDSLLSLSNNNNVFTNKSPSKYWQPMQHPKGFIYSSRANFTMSLDVCYSWCIM